METVFIGFIYRDYLKLLEKNYDSPLLKQVWIIFSTIVIFCGILILINKTFSKKSKYMKPYNLYKNTNKHPCVTYVKRFFICFISSFVLQIIFEFSKEQESRDIFNTDSYLMMIFIYIYICYYYLLFVVSFTPRRTLMEVRVSDSFQVILAICELVVYTFNNYYYTYL